MPPNIHCFYVVDFLQILRFLAGQTTHNNDSNSASDTLAPPSPRRRPSVRWSPLRWVRQCQSPHWNLPPALKLPRIFSCHIWEGFPISSWANYHLVRGWTNPFETYESKWVHLPQVWMKIKNIWNHQPAILDMSSKLENFSREFQGESLWSNHHHWRGDGDRPGKEAMKFA